MEQIPKIIHLIFLSKTEPIPDFFRECVDRMKIFHPDWEIRTYNEDDVYNILAENFPLILPIYNKYTHRVQKADIIRLILVYLYGGFYMDMDMYCLKKLDDLLRFNLVLGEEREIAIHKKHWFNQCRGVCTKYNLEIGNYMFGSIPKHPFWLYVLRRAVLKSTIPVQYEVDILESTGPLLLTEVYHTYRKRFSDITLLRNIDRECLHPLDNDIGCYFGNFAAHAHIGSWKWETKIGWNPVPEKRKTNYSKTADPDSLALTKDINAKILSSEFVNNIYLEKNDLTNENLPFDLEIIYQHLSKHCHFDSEKTENKVVLYLGGNFLSSNMVSKKETNILITNSSYLSGEPKIIDIINSSFAACFVQNDYEKKLIIQKGIKLPVFSTNNIYLQVKRVFEDEEDVDVMPLNEGFTIGFYCKNEKELIYVHDLAIKLNYLNNNISFLIMYDKGKVLRLKKMKGFCYRILNESNLSENLNSLSCFISSTNTSVNTLLTYTSLYLGKPVITNPEVIDDEILKYCKTVENNNIKECILDLKANYNHYNELAIEASSEVEDTYSIEKMVNKIFQHDCDLSLNILPPPCRFNQVF